MPRSKPIAAALNAVSSSIPPVTSYFAVTRWMSENTKIVLGIEILIDQAVLVAAYATTAALFGPLSTFVIALLGAATYLYTRLFGPLRTDKVVEAVCTAYDAGRSKWEQHKARAHFVQY